MTNVARALTLRAAAALLMISVLTFPAVSPAAGRVFYDSFEGGNTNLWSADNNGNKCLAKTSSVDGRGTHSGNYMAECNWDGTVPWNDARNYSSIVLKQWNYSREFLLRFWVRYSADVDHKMGNKVMRLYAPEQGNSFYIAGQMERTNGPLFVFFEEMAGHNGLISYGDGTVFGDGNWHKVEIYIKHNAAGASDGAVKVWRDGVLQLQGQNLVSATPNSHWYPFYVMSNWSSNPGWEHDANNHVYWDDIEVYSDAGTGATGSMADATIGGGGSTPPPAAVPEPPTDVSVQ